MPLLYGSMQYMGINFSENLKTQGIEPVFAIINKAVYTVVKQVDIIFSTY